MTHRSIEERVAARRDRALNQAFTGGRTSTVADRAPIYAPGERRSQARTWLMAILVMALALLWMTVSGAGDQQLAQFKILDNVSADALSGVQIFTQGGGAD